jgi:DNA invertase Pin-like site-specific DNA recombinase
MARASDASEGTTSTEAQVAMLRAYGDQIGMIYVDKIALDDVTGSMPGKRQDMAALLERKKSANDFDVLVLQRLDRLTRSGSGHGFWFEHECRCAGIQLLFVGDDIPDGRYANLIKVAKYEAAQEQAFSISQRSTQGAQLALEDGRNVTSSHTPYGCWRLYLHADGSPSHIIRDLRDGRQQKLHHETYEVIDTYGQIGGGAKGHYRKQKNEKTMLMLGDRNEIEVVREIFNLHFVTGWGGKRIADHLNAKGISSPQGKGWSQRQAEVIYEQEVYTGRSVGNRSSSAIYHERNNGAPKAVNLDPAIHATAKNIPVRWRPLSEWFIQDQPLMSDFLDDDVRRLAMAEHEELWQRRGDAGRPKRPKSKHKASDYLLTGLLFAKQDGEPLVGVLCGRVGHKVRYYRHRRARRSYRKGSVFNRMFPAEALEKAAMDVVQQIFSETPLLREQILKIVTEQSAITDDGTALEDLRSRREQLRKRTELLVTSLDEETLADARPELERLRIERRSLDEQIAAKEATTRARTVDPQTVTDRIVAQLTEMSIKMKTTPTFALRQLLGTVVEKIVADMESKEVEIFLAVPSSCVFPQQNAEDAMRLVGSRASSTSHETHQTHGVKLGVVDCRYVKLPTSVCFECGRRTAA